MEKKKKKNVWAIVLFIIGLVLYLGGLLLLFSSGISKTTLASFLFPDVMFTKELLFKTKTLGAILFLVGFVMFMLAVIFLYKDDKCKDKNVNLIIEGKADVITIIIMTYVMIFMIVVCLLYNQLIGALLFGLAIVIQSVVNSLLIKYYNKSYKRK